MPKEYINTFIKHPLGKIVDFVGVSAVEKSFESPQPQYPDVIAQHADRFALRMSHLGVNLIDHFRNLGDVAILTMMRGGIYTGLNLASLLKARTGKDVPVAAVRDVHQDNGLSKTTAWQTTEELRTKYPHVKNYLLVDGWVGTGRSIELTKIMFDLAFRHYHHNNRIRIYTVSPIDPISICDFSIKGDIVNSSTLYNADDLGISKPQLKEGIPVAEINIGVDKARILEPIEDFERRMSLNELLLLYSKKPNNMFELGMDRFNWGLGINEALARYYSQGHKIIATPSIFPLLDQLGIPYIKGLETLPFNWLAISVPEGDLKLTMSGA